MCYFPWHRATLPIWRLNFLSPAAGNAVPMTNFTGDLGPHAIIGPLKPLPGVDPVGLDLSACYTLLSWCRQRRSANAPCHQHSRLSLAASVVEPVKDYKSNSRFIWFQTHVSSTVFLQLSKSGFVSRWHGQDSNLHKGLLTSHFGMHSGPNSPVHKSGRF